MKFVVRKSAVTEIMKGIWTDIQMSEWIEKARKGEEVAGHKYISRKHSDNPKRPWIYFMFDDFLKKPIERLESFFGVTKEQLNKKYDEMNVKKDFNADKKTFAQHLAEYFSNREKWDKRFEKKENADKYKKPIIMEASEKVNDKEMETPAPKDSQLSFDFGEKKENLKWKANPSLMRRIWSTYSGKAIEQQEKNEQIAEKVIEQPTVKEQRKVKIRELPKYPTLNEKIADYVGLEEKDFQKYSWKNNKSEVVNLFKKYNLSYGDSDLQFNIEDKNGNSPKILFGRNSEIYEDNNNLIIDYANEKTVVNSDGIIVENPFNSGSQEEDEKEKARMIDAAYSSIEMHLIKNREISGELSAEQASKERIEHWENEIEDSEKQVKELTKRGLGVNQRLHDLRVETLNELIIKEETKVTESEAEKHANRSKGQEGNQNAKKYGLSEELYNQVYKMISELGYKLDDRSNKLRLFSLLVNNKKFNSEIKELGKENKENFMRIAEQIYNDYKEVTNGTDNIERNRISDDNGNIRNGESDRDSGSNVPETESATNESNAIDNAVQSGIGLTTATAISGNTERIGRVKKSQAIKIREKCREILASKSDDEMTEEDKAILSQYEGAGGLGEKGQTSKAVLTEFYTPRDVIAKIWQIVDKYNPKQDKKVLEPSSGIGRFAEGRNEKFTFCEIDETSARIAKILHPEADVKQGAFQEAMGFIKNNAVTKGYSGEKFDCAVGNPPYMAYNDFYSGLDKKNIHTRYEEYFMDKTLDTLKDGGVMAFVVPAGFLRSGNSKAKEMIASKGKLVEAYRLPKGTFSSTDIGTDIVVIQKGKGNVEDFNDNKYFTDNMNHIIGSEIDSTDRFGNPTKIVIAPEGKTIEEAINSIDTNAVEVQKQVEAIVDNIKVEKEEEPKIADSDIVEPTKPKSKICEKLGIEYTLERETKSGAIHKAAIANDKFWEWYNKDKTSAKNELAKNNMYLFKDSATKKWLVCTTDITESEAEKHANRSRAMLGNDNAKKLVHAERKKKSAEGELFTPSIGENMTSEQFNQKYSKNINKEDVKFWRLTDWDGTVDESSLTPKERDELHNSGRFIRTQNGYVNVVNYASGNIYKKIDDLENLHAIGEVDDEDYKNQKSILESVLPEKKNILDVKLDPKENFITQLDGGEFVKDFRKWLYDRNTDLRSYLELYNVKLWEITDYMDGKAVRSEDKDDPKANELKNLKSINRKLAAEDVLKKYISTLPEDEIKEIEDRYNRKFNAFVNPDFSKIPLFINGMNTHKGTMEFTLTDQQIEGVSRLCNKGNGILAYDVGVGKTSVGIVATINQLQTGAAKKPLICVPKAVYKNWIKEIKQLFPNQKINELSNLNAKQLAQFKDENGKINLPEGALNICTYEGLENITFKQETISGELSYDMTESQSVHDRDSNGNLLPDERSPRQIESEKEKIQKMLGMSAQTKEGAVFFEDLGIDHITVDELHNFKNIFSLPRAYTRSNKSNEDKKEEAKEGNANEYSGIQGATSKRGMKLFAISQLIQNQTNGKGFFGLSATPFNNSPVEIYNILSLVARNRLKEMDIFNMKDFMDAYAEFKMDKVVTAKGNVEQKKVMKSFKKLDSLQNLLTEFIDKVDGEEAGVIRPFKNVHLPELDLSPLQQIIMKVERERIEGKLTSLDENGKPKKTDAATLVAMNNMRMACLSPSLIDPKFYADYAKEPGWHEPKAEDIVKESPKLTFVCDSVVKQFKERPTEGQVIYMPRGVGGKKKKGDDDDNFADNIQGFEAMKKYLASKGVPADSVAFLRSDTNLDEKERIMNDYNDPNGKIKVIIGSETIKEGVNLNGNSTTLYNTMLGWNPTETTQVEGRIWRQGNKQGITHIVYPLMNDSIDAMMYQKYDEKSSRLNALWSYKGDSLNVEDINPEEMKFKLIKDPNVRAKMRIDEDVSAKDLQLRQLNVTYDDLEGTRISYEQLKTQIESEKKPYNLKHYQDKVDEQNSKVEEAEKELKTAKKSKDETKIKIAERNLRWAKDDLIREKSNQKVYLKGIEDKEKRIKSINAYWKQNGLKNVDEVQKRVEQISTQRQTLKAEIDELKKPETMEKLVAEASEQIRLEEANVKHATVSEQVQNVTQSIKENILPMDNEWRESLRKIVEAKRAKNDKAAKEATEKLYERFPGLKKSVIIKNGKVYIRKYVDNSAFTETKSFFTKRHGNYFIMTVKKSILQNFK